MKRLCLSILIILLFSYPQKTWSLPLGAKIPPLTAQSHSGAKINFGDLNGKIVVLEWFNMGCPFVQKHYRSKHMQTLQREYTRQGVIWLTVASTNPSHRNFMNAEQLTKVKAEQEMGSTDLIVDSDGALGKLFEATTTPDMVIINTEGKIVYLGAIDDKPDTSSDPASAVNYVKQALDSLLSGKSVEIAETEPYGCSIKYSS